MGSNHDQQQLECFSGPGAIPYPDGVRAAQRLHQTHVEVDCL